MINRLVRWAMHNRLVVILLAAGLLGYGIYAFRKVNVEAYPDPAPAIVEVVARYPGASAEEVERQVTIPLEVALAGMPGLAITRTQSLFELCHVSNQFEYGVDPAQARQEVLNRLRLADLPAGVTPDISPRSPTGEIFRYVLIGPKDSAGRDIYDPNDLKSLQDNTLERLFRRLPRVVDVTSYGGTVKRYEIHPDPARMQRYGITLQQLKDAIASNNSNVGGDYIIQGGAAHVVRSLGLLGMGQDPMETAMGMKDPVAARNYLRAEEERRIREIRQIVLSATNNVPVRVGDVVEGGPLRAGSPLGRQGVVMGYQTRLGHVMRSLPAARCPRPRSARRPRPARLARRGRSRRGHRPAAQGRPIAARPGRHPRPGQAAQRNPRSPAAGREDRALLRPHRPDPRHHRARSGKTCWPAWAWSRWCCCCSSATSAPR